MAQREQHHLKLCNALIHAQKHRDWILLLRQITGINKSQKRDQIITWIESFSPYSVEIIDGVIQRLKIRKGDKFAIDDALACPYWKIYTKFPEKQSKGPKEDNLQCQFKSFLNHPTNSGKDDLISSLNQYLIEYPQKGSRLCISIVQGGAPGLGKRS